nr:MAG TPA: hypothetical protein [Caudoviricetes sp.]
MKTFHQIFFDFLEDILDIKDIFYLYKLPSTKETETKIWWLVPLADSLSQKLVTFEKDYLNTYILNYRSSSSSDVDTQIEKAKHILNNLKCINLDGYKVIKIDCTSSSANDDLDTENAKRGSLTINIRLIKENI